MIRAIEAASIAALLLVGCGPTEELDAQVTDMESLLAESRLAVTDYSESEDASAFAPDVCAAHRSRYCDGMVERTGRMKMRVDSLDACVTRMGHADAMRMNAVAGSMSAAVEAYRRDGCQGGTTALNQQQARDHARIMYGHFDDMRARCPGLRDMHAQGMRCGG